MRACLFANDRLVLAKGVPALPSRGDVEDWGLGDLDWFPVEVPDSVQPAGIADKAGGATGATAALAEPDWRPPPGAVAVGLRAVLGMLAEPDLWLALTAAHLARWRRTSRFCGVCGTATTGSAHHKAMQCPACRHLIFPKVSPAVIVQVTRGAEILLGRSHRHPSGSYSVLAGFVDPGESLEDAVRREIEEESGVRVTDIRYFGSQPWPFPDSLMVGFTAAYESGALQRLDDELEDVGWFTADALPPVPPGYSIARALIDDFARRNGVDPAGVPTWRRR